MKFLIVDDVSMVRRVLCMLIDEMGENQCVEAENGAAALDLLRNGLFDFVITDINMPQMDGWELLAEIRGDLRLKNLPVLLITGNLGAQDRIRVESCGADGFLLKPFTLATLREKVAGIVEAANDIAV
ncbi:MAG: response regulator [Verrucomicrobiota bacterium]